LKGKIMAYTKSIRVAPKYKADTKYPRRLGMRESRTLQAAVDTVLSDSYTASADYAPTDEVKSVIVTADATVTLPASASSQGRTLTVMVSGSPVTATLAATGGDSIEAPTNGALDADEDYAVYMCVGTNWVLLNDGVS
jgi:hypothetical protein